VSDLALLILCLIAAAGLVYVLRRRPRDPRENWSAELARANGRMNAAAGMGRDDYPMDYTDAERDAWRAGWDEYHEWQ